MLSAMPGVGSAAVNANALAVRLKKSRRFIAASLPAK
jgi:hypothetical protein